jgi:hypothetical protein
MAAEDQIVQKIEAEDQASAVFSKKIRFGCGRLASPMVEVFEPDKSRSRASVLAGAIGRQGQCFSRMVFT